MALLSKDKNPQFPFHNAAGFAIIKRKLPFVATVLKEVQVMQKKNHNVAANQRKLPFRKID